jgi:hypothetical protein
LQFDGLVGTVLEPENFRILEHLATWMLAFVFAFGSRPFTDLASGNELGYLAAISSSGSPMNLSRNGRISSS